MLIHSYQLCPVEAFFKERPDTKNRCSDDACNDFLCVSLFLRSRQCLRQIINQILLIFQPNRNSDMLRRQA